MPYSTREKFCFFLSFEVGHIVVMVYDILMVLYMLSELIVSQNDNTWGIHIFTKTLKGMNELFLFYTAIIFLLILKLFYAVVVIFKRFNSYITTNKNMTYITYGMMILFNFGFALIRVSGLVDNPYADAPPDKASYAGFIFLGFLCIINAYFSFVAHNWVIQLKER